MSVYGKAYNRPVDRRLIEMDKGGALRDQIEIFRKLFEDQRFAEPLFDQIADTIEAGKPLINQPLWTLVATMMVVAGLVKNAGLVATKKIRAEDLERFKRLLTDNRVMIEEARAIHANVSSYRLMK